MFAFLNWSGDFAVGVGPLDHDHRDLLDAINDLQGAVEAEREPGIISELLRKVAVDTLTHFLEEEKMMSSTNYPGQILHAMKHQHLLSQLNAFLGRHSRDGTKMDAHSLNFLRSWFSTHIQSEDRNFAQWLNEHGKR
jgi:hemerythrin-like metal-binding protein